jgi:2',3'-cyclic-nucleotide 2'-phosphodiesterase (5'-nucleotidase family)
MNHPLIRKAFALVFSLSCVLVPGCGEKTVESADVIVLHTGRLRGNVYPTELQSLAPLQHYQFLAAYVKKVREEAKTSGAKVLLVDLGDSLQGSFASYATKSGNMIALFNALEYDVVALSNLDNAVQPETLSKLKAVVLNPFADAAGEPATKGTKFGTKLDKGGLGVFLMANYYGDTSSEAHPDRFPAWFGSTPSDVIPFRDYPGLAKTLGPKAPGDLSLLTWMKFESPTDPPAKFLEEIQSAGVDATLAHRIYGRDQKDIWSGSGFVDWTPPVSINILRNNGGFALARLDLKKDGDSWKVLKHEILPMTANTAGADPAILKEIGAFAKTIESADTLLAELPTAFDQERILETYMNALEKIPDTGAVLYSGQSIRSVWSAGDLRASRVFNSLPWTTGIVQLTMTRDQIAQAEKDIGLVSRISPDAGAGGIHVTTSDFFGRVIASRLGLGPEQIRPTAEKSEFGYFIAMLKNSPGILNPTQASPAASPEGAPPTSAP